MNTLSNSETLAALVATAAQSMWGVALNAVEEVDPPSPPSYARTVQLRIEDAPALSVIVAADDAGGRELGAVMFSCGLSDVSEAMLEDALCELANIVAGQIKSLVAPDRTLGLPIAEFGHQPGDRTLGAVHLRIGDADATISVILRLDTSSQRPTPAVAADDEPREATSAQRS